MISESNESKKSTYLTISLGSTNENTNPSFQQNLTKVKFLPFLRVFFHLTEFLTFNKSTEWNRQNEIDKRARITRKKKNRHTREAGPSSPRGPTQLLLLRRPPFKHRVYRYRSPRCFNFFAISHTACEKTIKQTSNERAREKGRRG